MPARIVRKLDGLTLASFLMAFGRHAENKIKQSELHHLVDCASVVEEQLDCWT